MWEGISMSRMHDFNEDSPYVEHEVNGIGCLIIVLFFIGLVMIIK